MWRTLGSVALGIWVGTSWAANSDEAWRALEKLKDAADQPTPAGANAVEFHAGRDEALHDAAAAFADANPTDPRALRAVLWTIETTTFGGDKDARRRALAQNRAAAELLLNRTDVDEPFWREIARTILFQRLNNADVLINRTEQTELADAVGAYLAQVPDDPKAVTLQIARANLLSSVDPDRGTAELNRLAASPDPALAEAAQARLAKLALIGRPLALVLTTLDGASLDLASLRGRVVLVDFWATWCPDCLRDFPTIKALHARYHDQGLALVGVSLDRDRAALARFLSDKEITWPQAYDGKGWDNDVAKRFSVRAIPEVWLLDRRGVVRVITEDSERLDTQVQDLLAEKDDSAS